MLPTSTSILPDSILDKSRMSLMRARKIGSRRSGSFPRTSPAASDSDFLRCLSARTRARIQKVVQRRAKLVRHVRTRENSLLYFEVSASCSALSSSACFACSISRILGFNLSILLRQKLRFPLQFRAFVFCSSSASAFDSRCPATALGSHGRSDCVQHDAAGFRQLVEECEIDV